MSTEEDHELADRWISPIMQLGNKIVSEVIDELLEDDNKSAAVISALQKTLNDEERVIFYCETLSTQCNMSGLNNFFNDSIALFYYEVINALETLGSKKMIQALGRCKELIFDGQDVPVGDEEQLEEFLDSDRRDWEIIEEQLEQIAEDSREEKEHFESLLCQYAIDCGESGKIPKRTG